MFLIECDDNLCEQMIVDNILIEYEKNDTVLGIHHLVSQIQKPNPRLMRYLLPIIKTKVDKAQVKHATQDSLKICQALARPPGHS